MRLNSVNFNTMLRRGAKRLPLLGVLCLAMGLSSCESILDEEPNCRLGIALNFVYDYHMEPGANAFTSNVDCVNVFVFDKNGNYVKQFTETTDVLRDPNYRMELPLDLGDYHLVVYGGTACEDASFELTPDFRSAESRSGSSKDDILVTLPLNEQGYSDKQLHDIEARTGGLFYGTLDVTLTDQDYAVEYREETVYLMKDTNNIQIILQELTTPQQIDYNDYDFYIIDDNFKLDGYNNVIHTATADFQPYYRPYASENRIMGYVEYKEENGSLLEESEEIDVQVACVEFSTSRLLTAHLPTARLVVYSKLVKDAAGNNKKIIDIPLITYLSAVRGFGDSWIKSDQEFLDRQSRWTLMFFLQRGAWVQARVSVNWWTVRINDIELDY